MEHYFNTNLGLEEEYQSPLPPHLVPEYREWMCQYLGVMGEVINSQQQDDLHYKTRERLRKSFYGEDMYAFDTISNQQVGFGKEYDYRLLFHTQECWVPGCSGNYFIFQAPLSYDQTRVRYMIVFNVGAYQHIPKVELKRENRKSFLTFLNWLQELNETADEIVLCGHSNGMVAATFTAFLLACLARINEDYFIHQQLVDYRTINEIVPDNDYRRIYLCNNVVNKLVVCGTGGFPLLFRTKEQFDTFYDILQGRYLHVCIGFQYADIIEVDPYIGSRNNLHNFDYHIYTYIDYPVTNEMLVSDAGETYYAGLGHPDRSDTNLKIEYVYNNDMFRFKTFLHNYLLYRRTLTWHFCR